MTLRVEHELAEYPLFHERDNIEAFRDSIRTQIISRDRMYAFIHEREARERSEAVARCHAARKAYIV